MANKSDDSKRFVLVDDNGVSQQDKDASPQEKAVAIAPERNIREAGTKEIDTRETELRIREAELARRESELALRYSELGYVKDKHTSRYKAPLPMWFWVIVMSIITIVATIVSSYVTAHLMTSGTTPPVIEVSDRDNALTTAVAVARPNIVEISATTSTGNTSNGSGFIVSFKESECYIITNYHVVGSRDGAQVRFYNEHNYYDSVNIGFNEEYDVSVIKVSHVPTVTPFEYDGSDLFSPDIEYSVGERVFTAGNSSSNGTAVFDGIVSMTSAICKIAGTTSLGSTYTKHVPVLQTTAAINAGTSGGGMFNLNAQYMGVTTYRVVNSNNSSVQQVFYTVPVSIVYPIYRAIMMNGGEYTPMDIGYNETSGGRYMLALRDLGVTVEYTENALEVTGVDSGISTSLKTGDVITKIGDTELQYCDYSQLVGSLFAYRRSGSGDSLVFTVKRGGAVLTSTYDNYKTFY